MAQLHLNQKLSPWFLPYITGIHLIEGTFYKILFSCRNLSHTTVNKDCKFFNIPPPLTKTRFLAVGFKKWTMFGFDTYCSVSCELLYRAITKISSCYNLGQNCWENCIFGGIFSELRSRPILPSPLPLEAMLLGLLKKARSLSISRKQLWIGGGGILYAKPLIWKQFCCVR